MSARGNRLYINVDAYDKANAKSILFDVVTELQANELLIADFGHMLYQRGRTLGQALTPMRGGVYQQYRPDFVLHEDHENSITAESSAVTGSPVLYCASDVTGAQ